MKKMIVCLCTLCAIWMLASCATQLPPFNPSLPEEETVTLIIPAKFIISEMDGQSVDWEDGNRQVRIPAGEHSFTVRSREDIAVYSEARVAMQSFTGSTQNFDIVKQWVGPNTVTRTFEAGETYIMSSAVRHSGTFDSQRVSYSISLYNDSYPEDLTGMAFYFGGGPGWQPDSFYFNGGISLKPANMPIFWTLNIGTSLGLSADYLFYNRLFPTAGLFAYAGAGFGVGIPLFSGEEFGLAALARVPLGLSYMWVSNNGGVDLYLQGTPTIGTKIPQLTFPYGFLEISLGFRLWY
jgi:hypothetical protein